MRTMLIIGCALGFAGCSSYPQPVYEGKHGFRITPPPGWVERARDDLLPARAARPTDPPLPFLEPPEKLLVRYDRTIPGQIAWLRVSAADLPAAISLKDVVSTRSPQSDWKPESEVESLEVNGLSAARGAFAGRWQDHDYISETVAVRHGEQVYFITASFPAVDKTAREEARQAVARATWKK